MDEGLVSVIVPTFNSEMSIRRLLESIKRQTYKNIETIVVDQSSYDKTTKIAREYDAIVLSLPPPKFYSPPTKSRNFGAKHSRGELLFHIDSDMELTLEVVEECVKHCKDGADTVIIHEIDVGENFWARCISFRRSCHVNDPYLEAPRFFTRRCFESVGGYDETLSFGEDLDMHYRVKHAGNKVLYVNSRIIHHLGRINLFERIRKSYNYGRTFEKYLKKYPIRAKKQFGPISPAFIRNWRKLAADPLHTLGMVILELSTSLTAGMGFISGKLVKQ